MATSLVKLSRIVHTLLPVPNIAVFEQLEYTDDSGKVTAQMLPGRDVTAADAQAAGFDPLIAAQQERITDLTAQLATAKSNADQAAQDLAAAKAATADVQGKLDAALDQVDSLQKQLAAVTAPIPATQNAAQQAAAVVFNALSVGKRALWEPVRVAVDAALAKLDLATAREIIATVPEIYDGMDADRATFLALFPAPAQG